MRKNFLNKMLTAVLSLTMVVSMVGTVSAASHAANGANIAKNAKWNYFSLISKDSRGNLDSHSGHVAGENGTRQHPYCWYHALEHIRTDKYPEGQKEGTDFATEGYIVSSSASSASFYVKNSGWDGQYNERDGSLVGDNQWGLRLYTEAIPVEKGRNYTLTFTYKSTLTGTKTIYETDEDGDYVLDSDGNKIPKKDENNKDITEPNYKKHISVSVVNPANSNGLDFLSVSNCTSDGFIVADSQEDAKTVTVKFKVPSNYAGNSVSLQFAMGAFIVSYPDELAMKGYFNVTDMSIKAGTQHKVTYKYGNKTSVKYINDGERTSGYVFPVAGKTFSKYTSNGKTFSLSTAIKKDTVINCVYTNTAKPAKAKVKFKAQKKKAQLKFTKIKNCVGYEVKYSAKKNMKGAKTKNCKFTAKNKPVTVKKLKSGKKTFFQIRSYNLDSAGKKVYSRKVLKKTVIVK